MDERVKKQLRGCPRFETKEEALQEAVKRKKENDERLEMVMRQEDGKFLLCDVQNWEIAINFGGCEPVYTDLYIYDLAVGRETSEEDNEAAIDVMLGTKAAEERRKRRAGVKKAATYAQLSCLLYTSDAADE